ncbi:MAG TPA: tetratricopeptide repeat protein, partial [Thermomonas sp.]|nr:tetratricopeptide repeat protein [Thermomonas sp.]
MNEAQRLYADAVDALNRRQWQAARAMGLRLIAMVPDHGGVHFVAGVASLQLQQLPEGIRHLQRAVHLSPKRPDYAAQFARALAMARLTREALVAADAASAMGPGDPATLDTLGVVYTQANEHAKAIALFEQAARKVPAHAAYRFNLGTSYTFLGDLEQAEREYEACLALEPGHGKAHLALAQLRKATPDANHVARLQGLLVDAGDAAARMYLNLALAKEQEDLGDDARAFAHLTAGKAAGGEGRGYRAERDVALFAAIEQATPAGTMSAPGSASEEPIFVIGMPRSGTTLVDRILSSHPLVH